MSLLKTLMRESNKSCNRKRKKGRYIYIHSHLISRFKNERNAQIKLKPSKELPPKQKRNRLIRNLQRLLITIFQ